MGTGMCHDADRGRAAEGVGEVQRQCATFLHRQVARAKQTRIPRDEHAAHARLRYVLGHGTKEGLVSSPGSWPGPNCIAALTRGELLRGTWFDRSAGELSQRTLRSLLGGETYARVAPKIAEVLAGMHADSGHSIVTEPDREKAIALAIGDGTGYQLAVMNSDGGQLTIVKNAPLGITTSIISINWAPR